MTSGCFALGLFGQVVIGPPGSGKSTYCSAMQEFLAELGKVVVVNLDPANEELPYSCEVDLRDLITLDDVMEALQLGPNGGLLYCMEYLYANRQWLAERLRPFRQQSVKTYLIFDCPGQVGDFSTYSFLEIATLMVPFTAPPSSAHSHYLISDSVSAIRPTVYVVSLQVELYCNNTAFRKLLTFLTHTPTSNSSLTDPRSGLGLRLAAVHLVDSHYCTDAGKFISVLLTSLVAMLQLSLPHVNVLSKIDLVELYGQLPFNLDFFTEVLNLSHLVEQLEDDLFFAKYKRMNQALADLVQDRSLITFQILNAQDRTLLHRVMQCVDKANGYVFGREEQQSLQALLSCAAGAEFTNDLVCMAQERYTSRSLHRD
ncbi:GPN-loop GTPase [Echinococcus granulosus]|uniref:GPN-loop GTPase 2 n=1 Tax=Echinococcus granulosus TaxID=6210 RepID=W6UVF3_ECHGR|nr:GPN-loop GTPase [Echinococcus granulosus]EUB64616.1 GPN-loop GTPase [Echinococcus granulosus]